MYGFEEAYAYSRDMVKNSAFCDKMAAELGYSFTACATAEDAVRNADVIFTQTPGGEWVLDLNWLRPHALIIASGSDQPTKNEIPPEVMRKAKVVTDITAQCARVGELCHERPRLSGAGRRDAPRASCCDFLYRNLVMHT